MGLSGYKNTQRGRLGAHRIFKVICRRVIRNFLKCYMYCMSGPSLHRQSTDCLIQLQVLPLSTDLVLLQVLSHPSVVRNVPVDMQLSCHPFTVGF